VRALKIAAAVATAAIAGAGLASAPAADATFPGRNGEIVYSWLDGSAKNLWTGSGVGAFSTRARSGRNLYSCVWGGHADTARFCKVLDTVVSADGETVAAVEVVPGSTDRDFVHRLSFRTLAGEEMRSVPLGGVTFDPAWSPDGRQLVMTRYEGDDAFGQAGTGASRLVVIDLEGHEVAAVGGPGASDADWSARGEIAFAQSGNLWIASPGGAPRQVTRSGGAAPSWSPDGRRLAFVRDGRIWTIRADATRERRIGGTGRVGAATWSPDGRYLAFTRDIDGTSRAWTVGSVWVMRSDGRCPHAVRRERGYFGYGRPSWASLPGKPSRGAAPACGKKKPKQAKPRRTPSR
jgi:Tol biopolymer transport system component